MYLYTYRGTWSSVLVKNHGCYLFVTYTASSTLKLTYYADTGRPKNSETEIITLKNSTSINIAYPIPADRILK